MKLFTLPGSRTKMKSKMGLTKVIETAEKSENPSINKSPIARYGQCRKEILYNLLTLFII